MNPNENPDNLVLWNKFVCEGDQDALSAIYLNHYDLLFNYGLRYTCNKLIIEDSIQNIFGYFLKVRQGLCQVSNLTGYLFKSFQRQLFLDLKSQKNLVFPGELPEDNFNYFNSPELDVILKENGSHIKEALRICISRLSPKQQEIIYLRFECEFSYKTISAILDIDLESCHKSIYRSIKSIRTEMVNSGFDMDASTSSVLIRQYKKTISNSRN